MWWVILIFLKRPLHGKVISFNVEFLTEFIWIFVKPNLMVIRPSSLTEINVDGKNANLILNLLVQIFLILSKRPIVTFRLSCIIHLIQVYIYVNDWMPIINAKKVTIEEYLVYKGKIKFQDIFPPLKPFFSLTFA